jgi:putative ABC transport system substrate-binding protein
MSAELGVELNAKRLQLLKEAFPAISRIAALWNPTDPVAPLRATEEAARTLGLRLHTIEVPTPDEIPAGFERATAARAEALVVLPDAMFWNERTHIVHLVAKHRIPAIYPEREYADDGGLLAYGRNVPESFHRFAIYVDKILKGTMPGDLPIEQPTKFELIANLKTAAALGLTIPPSILARADEVIE